MSVAFTEPEWIDCPSCGHEMPWYGDGVLPETCGNCGHVVLVKPTPPEPEHRPVSVGGWTCDVCGVTVNGQTDADGWAREGETVKHTP